MNRQEQCHPRTRTGAAREPGGQSLARVQTRGSTPAPARCIPGGREDTTVGSKRPGDWRRASCARQERGCASTLALSAQSEEQHRGVCAPDEVDARLLRRRRRRRPRGLPRPTPCEASKWCPTRHRRRPRAASPPSRRSTPAEPVRLSLRVVPYEGRNPGAVGTHGRSGGYAASLLALTLQLRLVRQHGGEPALGRGGLSKGEPAWAGTIDPG